ncbi:TetR/AcrR family transcriptional regulator C-terminal domain-containing protein [Longispora sp. NPDC051575]|uniref:TetR/AcrR family transcriptional regulator n=1 Tax=Longispora sp. NPDC051575 TaxID=3154943 RepID=UPI003433B60D
MPKTEGGARSTVALLWGEQGQPTRGPKPSLTPARIAEAAVAVADAEGLDAVSMAKVATSFGVSGMALYRYVPGKDELVDLMVEVVLAERPDLTDAGPDWRPRITAWARAISAIYQAHPWLVKATTLRRHVTGPRQFGWMDTALAALELTGLSYAQQHQAFLLVIGHVRVTIQQSADFDADYAREWGRLTAERLDRDAERFPALTRAIAAGAFEPAGADALEFGLDRILDGVQALIERAPHD